jgi:ABC-type uncharacterized transport system ATPase subunit
MTTTKILTGISLLTLAGLMIVPVTNAYRGDPNVQGPNYTAERHEDMTNAFENKNYNEWKNQMQEKGRVTEVINEGNFARFAEAHKLMLEGKTEQANQIREELGLGLHDGSGHGNGRGYGRNR